MIRGTADGMVAGTAVGMIPGSTARPAIGATARPSASAGVGAASTPATGARLGAGGLVIGAVDIGVALGGIITIMQHRIIVLMQVVQLLMQIVIGVAEVEMVVRLIGSLRVIDTIMAQPLL